MKLRTARTVSPNDTIVGHSPPAEDSPRLIWQQRRAQVGGIVGTAKVIQGYGSAEGTGIAKFSSEEILTNVEEAAEGAASFFGEQELTDGHWTFAAILLFLCSQVKSKSVGVDQAHRSTQVVSYFYFSLFFSLSH